MHTPPPRPCSSLCMMAGRAPPDPDDQDDDGYRPPTASDSGSHARGTFRVDPPKVSDGFEMFRFAMASGSNNSGARTAPTPKQPEQRQQKALPKKQQTQRLHGTAALLTENNLTQLQKSAFRVPASPSSGPASTTVEPPRSSQNTNLAMNPDAIEGMYNLLSSIQEATEPPTSSPHQAFENSTRLNPGSEVRRTGSPASSSGRRTPIDARSVRQDRNSHHTSQTSKRSIGGKDILAPSPLRSHQVPGSSAIRPLRVSRPTESVAASSQSTTASELPTTSANKLFKAGNPFKENQATSSVYLQPV